MITMYLTPGSAPLAYLCPDRHTAEVRTGYYDGGRIIVSRLRDMQHRLPMLRVEKYVIMPDHIHFILNVTEPVEWHLDQIITALARRCISPSGVPLLSEWYNDRILTGRHQLDSFFRYIDDNPRRLFLRREHPSYFLESQMTLGRMRFGLYGNCDLAADPVRVALRISRRFSAGELAARQALWQEVAREQGVIISPFISRAERAVRRSLVRLGARVALIRHEAFPERFKPQGELFDLCAAGRLLIISLGYPLTNREPLRRRDCEYMNRLAEIIAEAPSGSIAIRPVD